MESRRNWVLKKFIKDDFYNSMKDKPKIRATDGLKEYDVEVFPVEYKIEEVRELKRSGLDEKPTCPICMFEIYYDTSTEGWEFTFWFACNTQAMMSSASVVKFNNCKALHWIHIQCVKANRTTTVGNLFSCLHCKMTYGLNWALYFKDSYLLWRQVVNTVKDFTGWKRNKYWECTLMI